VQLVPGMHVHCPPQKQLRQLTAQPDGCFQYAYHRSTARGEILPSGGSEGRQLWTASKQSPTTFHQCCQQGDLLRKLHAHSCINRLP